MQLQYLQGQPFLSYKEKYGLAASVKLSNPVLDFNMLYNSCLEYYKIRTNLEDTNLVINQTNNTNLDYR